MDDDPEFLEPGNHEQRGEEVRERHGTTSPIRRTAASNSRARYRPSRPAGYRGWPGGGRHRADAVQIADVSVTDRVKGQDASQVELTQAPRIEIGPGAGPM